jgi:hypothetical protein
MTDGFQSIGFNLFMINKHGFFTTRFQRGWCFINEQHNETIKQSSFMEFLGRLHRLARTSGGARAMRPIVFLSAPPENQTTKLNNFYRTYLQRR